MSRTPHAAKLFLAVVVSAALTGSILAAGTGSIDTRSDTRWSSSTTIEDAQAILEANRYLAPGGYDKGEMDQPTISAISHFQAAHTLSQTGQLNFDTTAELWSHRIAPRSDIATSFLMSPACVNMPATIYRPTSEPLFVENKPLILTGVEFDIDKATLRPESRTTLDQVATSLKTWPDVMVEIQGHTSEPGTAMHNMDLSQRRAAAVMAYFVAEGIDPSRLVANGYGQTRFIATNDTPEGRQENRRVELHEIR
jgi:OOP family OmpA-OmpF porin